MAIANMIRNLFNKDKQKESSIFEELFRLAGFVVIFIVDLSVSATFFSSLGEGWILVVGGVALTFMKVWNWIEAQSTVGIVKKINLTAWALIMMMSIYSVVNYGLSNTQMKSIEDTAAVEAETSRQELNKQLEAAQVQAQITNLSSWTQEKTQILARIKRIEGDIATKTADLAAFRKENGVNFPDTQKKRQAEIDALNASITVDRNRLAELDKLISSITTAKVDSPTAAGTTTDIITKPTEVKRELNAEIVFRQTLGDYFRIGIIIFFFIFGTAVELTLATSSMKSAKETEEMKKKRIEKRERMEEQKLLMKEEKDKIRFQKYQIEQNLKLERYRLKIEAQKKEIVNKISLDSTPEAFNIFSLFNRQHNVPVDKPRPRKKKTVPKQEFYQQKFAQAVEAALPKPSVQIPQEEKEQVNLTTPDQPVVEPVVETVVTAPIVDVKSEVIETAVNEPTVVETVSAELVAVEPIVEPVEEKTVEPTNVSTPVESVNPVEPEKTVSKPEVNNIDPVKEKISMQLKQKLEAESRQNAQILYVINKLFDKIDHGGQHLLTADEAVKIIPGIDKVKIEKIFKFLSYNNVIYFDGLNRAWKPKMGKEEVLEIVETKLTKVKGV